ncbi:MAG: putative RNA uridine N3 methyltransferase [Nitrososphaeria archaeon]
MSIFIPDSILCEESTLRDKTIKLGFIARACSIFRVGKIYVYTEEKRVYERDYHVIKSILEYAETPQYLRKHLFTKSNVLREVGILPPLKTPHHKPYIKLDEVKVGDLREGVLVRRRGSLFVDVGLSSLIEFEGSGSEGERLTVVFTKVGPSLSCRRAFNHEVDTYWGYKVIRVGSLGKVLKSGFSGLKIVTSRLGVPINERFNALVNSVIKSDNITLIYGSPKKGVYDILKKEGLKPEDVSDFTLNFVPGQGTSTIRSEEAIIISLSIVNLILKTFALKR